MSKKSFETRCHLAGWGVFIFSSFFFIAGSLEPFDLIGFMGGVSFLMGCLIFLIPFFKK